MNKRGETHARISADLVILGRSGVDSQDLVFDIPSATSLLNATDLEFEDIPTGRYDVVLMDNSRYELQFSFFGFPNNRAARAVPTGTDLLSVYYDGLIVSAEPGDDRLGVVYLSEFGSAEANVRYRLGEKVTLLSGFRYFGLREDMWYVFEETVSGTTRNFTGYFTNVDNQLFGYQLGAESVIWSNDRWQVVVVGKGGIFGNRMEVGAQAPDPIDATASITLDQTDSLATFAGELQLVLNVSLGSGSLRLGYQLFGISDVALAPDQLDNFAILTNSGTFDTGRVLYQGGFVGVEIPF